MTEFTQMEKTKILIRFGISQTTNLKEMLVA